jgi:hypothetical protein
LNIHADIDWPSLNPQLLSVEDLIPYVNNSRIHSQDQINQVAASINEWGFTNPILIDEKNMILAGHCRLLAAQKLKLDKVPVIIARGWSEEQKKAYIIADNKLSLNSSWDKELLKAEIKQLEVDNYNLDFVGFNVEELTELFLDKEFGTTDAFDEWQDMPEYDNEDMNYYRSFKIHFNNQEDLDEFIEKTGLQITEKTRSTVYPKPEKLDLKAYIVSGTDSAA